MNRDEAHELLNQVRPLDQWRRHDTHAGYDPTSQAAAAGYPPRFNHVAQQMSFPPVSRYPYDKTCGRFTYSVNFNKIYLSIITIERITEYVNRQDTNEIV